MCASPAALSAAGLAVVVRRDDLAVVDDNRYCWIQGIECGVPPAFSTASSAPSRPRTRARRRERVLAVDAAAAPRPPPPETETKGAARDKRKSDAPQQLT
jgi:hypothetical protein